MSSKTYSFFDETTGELASHALTCLPHLLPANIPPGLAVIEGRFDSRSQQVDVVKFRQARSQAHEEHAARVEKMRSEFVAPMPESEFVEPPHELFVAAVEHVIERESVPDSGAARDRALAAIDQLERRQPRAVREHALGVEGARERLQRIEEQITELRAQLAS